MHAWVIRARCESLPLRPRTRSPPAKIPPTCRLGKASPNHLTHYCLEVTVACTTAIIMCTEPNFGSTPLYLGTLHFPQAQHRQDILHALFEGAPAGALSVAQHSMEAQRLPAAQRGHIQLLLRHIGACPLEACSLGRSICPHLRRSPSVRQSSPAGVLISQHAQLSKSPHCHYAGEACRQMSAGATPGLRPWPLCDPQGCPARWTCLHKPLPGCHVWHFATTVLLAALLESASMQTISLS